MDIIDDQDIEKDKDLSFELKAFRSLALTYFFFGLFEIFEFGVFLVPVPIVFVIVPVLALIYAFMSRNHWQSIVLLLIPILVLQQLWIAEYPNLFQLLSILAILIWMFWAIRFFYVSNVNTLPGASVLAASHVFIPLVLLSDNLWIAFIALILPGIGASIFYIKNQDNKNILPDLRVALLIIFIELLVLLFALSMWTVSLQSSI